MAASLEFPLDTRSPDPLTVALTLSREFAATAVERDRRGGTPKHERDALRASGLLTLIVPKPFGGLGASWATALDAVRILARSDGSIAHVFGFQHLLLATVRLFGTRQQFETLARGTVAGRWFWGNALNPLDTRATIERGPSGALLQGEKSFCSGARDADVLVVSAHDTATGKLVVAAISADRAGITARGDAAAAVLDHAWARGEALTPKERGECAVSIAAAKVITTRAGLDISTRIFDATGARGTTARLGLDRFWRDLRTHTLHDPVDYKRRDIGRFWLTGEWPKPTFYS